MENGMKKNEIYLDMLFWSLPHIRNKSTQRPWSRIKDVSIYYESGLIYQLDSVLRHECFDKNDIWFLNSQARWYYEHCDEKKSILYSSQLERISALFALVPEDMKKELEWSGPKQ